MNAEEVVRYLRKACDGCDLTPCCEYEVLGKEATDLIESLQAQLTASQQETRAAVEDLKKLDRREPFGGRNCANKSECYEENRKIGGNYPECANCTEWQWRGPAAGEEIE